MAAVPLEIHSFMLKFNQLSNAGVNASLNLNCVNGRVYANLVADLGLYQNFHDGLSNTHVFQPSYRRRRRRHKCSKKSEEVQNNTHDESTVSDLSRNSSEPTLEEANTVEANMEDNLRVTNVSDSEQNPFPDDISGADASDQYGPSTAVVNTEITSLSSVSHPFPALNVNDDGTVWTPPTEEDILHYLHEHGYRLQNLNTHSF